MKKAIFLTLLSVLILVIAIPATAAAEITVFIDGVQIVFDVPPIIIEGRTMVPLRAIFEGLDMTVYYESATKMITGTSATKRVVLQVNSTAASVTDLGTGITTAMTLDVPAQIVESRTVVPLRFVGESTGAAVAWDGPTRTINITTSTSTPEPAPDNDPPTALADPVTFSIGEQALLTISVDDLAVDTDGLMTDELAIIQTLPDGGPDYGSFGIALGGASMTFLSDDIATTSTQTTIVAVSDGTHMIYVNIEIMIMPEMVIVNLPPEALGDPVKFSTFEQVELVISVVQLAEDTDGLSSDELSIVDYNFDGTFIGWGSFEVAPDGLSITFTSRDVLASATQLVVITVSDGTYSIDVNVEIVVNTSMIAYINLSPVALANPVEFSVYDRSVLEVDVDELAEDLDFLTGDTLEITEIVYPSLATDYGDTMIASDNLSFTFTPIDVDSAGGTQTMRVAVTDGTHTINVNVEIFVSNYMMMYPYNPVPVAVADPVEFEVYEITDLVVEVEELAVDLNGEDLTIVSIANRSIYDLDFGTEAIAADNKSFTFRPANISSDSTQYLTVQVTDGIHIIDVNVAIEIGAFSMPNFYAPSAKDDPVEFSILEMLTKEIMVADLAYDNDPLIITNIILKPGTISYGTQTMVSGNKSFIFDPESVTEDRIQYLIVTVSDGSATVDVNVEIKVDNFTFPTF